MQLAQLSAGAAQWQLSASVMCNGRENNQCNVRIS